MHLRFIISLIVVALSTPAIFAQGTNQPTVDELVAKNIEAKGGATALDNLRTLRSTGKLLVPVQGVIELGYLQTKKRPDNVRTEASLQGMSESSRQDESRTWWKEAIKRRMVDLFSAALVGGQRHVEYLVELGMPRERVVIGYDVVDNDYFGQGTTEIRDSHLRRGYGGQAAFETRNKRSLPETYFLASARFVEKKNLPTLIRAYAEYRRRSEIAAKEPWELVLLGDGPLRDTLNSQLSSLNLTEHVHLPGFKPYDELPVYYALANAFVHDIFSAVLLHTRTGELFIFFVTDGIEDFDFDDDVSWHAHRGFVCVQQSRSKMVPGKILYNATSGGSAHFLHYFAMPIQMLERRRNCIHISGLYDDSLDSITDHITRLMRGDLRQSARCRFVRHFRAAFPLRGKNMNCPLVEIILRIANESDNANIIAPELL